MLASNESTASFISRLRPSLISRPISSSRSSANLKFIFARSLASFARERRVSSIEVFTEYSESPGMADCAATPVMPIPPKKNRAINTIMMLRTPDDFENVFMFVSPF